MEAINQTAVSKFFSSEGRSIYSKAEKTVNKYGMKKYIESGVLVGLSGGADSVMLLCFLLEYKNRNNLDFPLIAVHINHGIRGDEADRDERFAKGLCEALNVECFLRKIVVPDLAKESGIGIEEAARNARYFEFIRIIQGRNDISSIAVAHNMSDNAETVIFNILRGSGSRGASGIRPVRENIFRPLIEVTKGEIISSLDAFGISYVTDSTNLSVNYTRNYVRHEIIPRLSRVNSCPEKMLSRFSSNLRGDDEFITSVATDFLKSKDEILNTDLSSLHFSVFIRVLTIMAGNFCGNISSSIASDVYDLLSKDNFSYSLGNGVTFFCERGRCRVTKNENTAVKSNFFIQIGEGITSLAPFNAEFILSLEKNNKTYLNVYKMAIQADLSSVIIDGSLYLRPKKDGDTVYYGGMTHKLKKLFNDRKIPLSKRALLPILCDNKGVVWVPGFGVRDDNPPKDERKKLFAIIGINDKQSDEGRLVFGSEFRS